MVGNEARWELVSINLESESFTILDKLVKSRRAYHVPFLVHVEIVAQSVYIFTSKSKIMELNLSTASRQFLSTSQLKDLKKIQQIYNSINFVKNIGAQPTSTLKKFPSLPTYAFLNTITAH